MIVSFHPLFEADKNIICAGREPNIEDLSAIKAADAVILPQGCSQALNEMASKNCQHVFPNYAVRFRYPGKIGQIQLFRATHTPHPQTEIYPSVASFRRRYGKIPPTLSFQLPCVFKFDWGGEGDTVYLIQTSASLQQVLQQSEIFEKSGQTGFLLQEYIPNQNKTLRVVIIGRRTISYWRVQKNNDGFLANLSKGAVIDTELAPDLQKKTVAYIENFSIKTGINLAGFDVIFSRAKIEPKPLLLEINYFFGRKGLGGSEAYYAILQKEIRRWLLSIGLKHEKKEENPTVCLRSE
jgi:ribosomal protein S6--L-glutamate ligase